MAQADAALVAIKMRLDAWDKIEYFESKDAYMRFREVKSRILGANIKNWEREPPWKEREKVGVEVGVHEVDGRGVVGVARVYRA